MFVKETVQGMIGAEHRMQHADRTETINEFGFAFFLPVCVTRTLYILCHNISV